MRSSVSIAGIVILLICATSHAQDFTLPQFLNVQYARQANFNPTGSEICFVSNVTGEPQVWRGFVRPGAQLQVTFEEDGVDGAWWSPVSQNQMIVSASRGGSEKSRLFLVNPNMSPMLPVTPDDEAIYRFGAWSPDGALFCYSTNRRNGTDFDIYEHHIDEPEPRLVCDAGGHLAAVCYSRDNRYMIILRSHSNVNEDLLLWDRESGAARVLTEHEGIEDYSGASFDSTGNNILVASNRGREFAGVASINISSGVWRWLETPDAEVEYLSVAPNGKSYAFVVNNAGYSEFNLVDLNKDERVGSYRFPKGIIRSIAYSPDGSKLAIVWGSANRPFNVWLYDYAPEMLSQLTVAGTGGIPAELFVEPELIRFETFDGRQIPAFWYRPRGVEGKAPVIISIHGGPESQARPDLSGLYQYWLHNGYAILEPNVRGSSGFGREYLALDDVRKRMDSVKDIEWAVKWLKARKDVDAKKLVVQGGSYGGFMALACLTTYPEMFAAGIDEVGIANFETFLQNTGKYRRALREAEYGTLENDLEFLREVSPVNHVDKIKAPLFVIQGANDPRVPQSESDQMVEAIRAKGGVVEYLVFKDEGHGLAKTENRITAYQAVQKFLDKYVKDK
jgi:dipeptidyl aminopeptidase/acylaminoacyl peptidase